MNKSNFKLIISLLFMVFLFSCSEKDLLPEDVNIAPLQEEIPVNANGETFVSSEQALEIAGKFLSGESGTETRALANAAVATVTDEKNNNAPAMYVVNYPEGGWVIVSATRNYFPVLAHSDKGSFNLENVSQSGISVWVAETKDAVRLSESLADSVKVQINTQWLAYEDAQKKSLSAPQTRSYQAMYNRISQLQQMYTSYNYYFSLAELENSNDFDADIISELLGWAQDYSSPPEYTIVAFRRNNITTFQKGPLLTTTWGQWYPFNYFCPPGTSGASGNYPAGCVAVAMGQIMNYHRKPALVSNPYNHKYNWNNMSETYSSSLPVLLRAIGVDVDMSYGTTSLAGIDDAQYAFKNIYGYTTVTRANHDAAIVKSHLNATPKGRPVYMRGEDSINGGGHAWVCDGVKDEIIQYEFFVEYFNGSSYSTGNDYTPSNPGVTLSPVPPMTFYNMNWGWNGEHDGWFYNNFVNPNGYNFQYNRRNLYIIP
ncbi:MAG: C10 family peptidase [Bacteroidales bacterium]|jgi:hypothetical protein|nr:C10 family peptidase [Bacteroidales bacterium]